jgi:hypothetical protein
MTIICDVNYKPDGIYAGTARPFAKMMTKFRLWLNVYVHKTHDLHTPEFFLKKIFLSICTNAIAVMNYIKKHLEEFHPYSAFM